MMTIEEATAVLLDTNAREIDRTQAAHFLGESGSETAATALVSALDDDDYGVHWAASEGLAQLGDAAMPALLNALVSSYCSPRVVNGAKHAFHTSVSQTVRAETKELLQTMHGSARNISTMEAASSLMENWAKSGPGTTA